VSTVVIEQVGAQLDEARRVLHAHGWEVVAAHRSSYATSHLTYDLTVTGHDGARRELVWKSLSDRDLLPEARGHRPPFVADPFREPLVYRSLLARDRLGTAECVAHHVDEADGTAWLVLEKVDGRELYQLGDIAQWQQAARWLAAFHELEMPPREVAARLVRCDDGWFAQWPDRARASMESASIGDRRLLDTILERYVPMVPALAAMPRTLVHGEFYASNVVVDQATGRVCPVDWEMTGIGPPLLDVAALVSGSWTDADRSAIGDAYLHAIPADERPSTERFRADLDLCRLHLCIQWLGWSPGWVPPSEHAADWLTTASQLITRLDPS
jgi:hypothetical protein